MTETDIQKSQHLIYEMFKIVRNVFVFLGINYGLSAIFSLIFKVISILDGIICIVFFSAAVAISNRNIDPLSPNQSKAVVIPLKSITRINQNGNAFTCANCGQVLTLSHDLVCPYCQQTLDWTSISKNET
jgi:hypothetical protein